MTTATFFHHIIDLVRDRCGVVLEQDKEYLVQARLEPRFLEWQVRGMDDLWHRLEAEPGGELAWQVVEALVPNETSFFRDPHVFKALEDEVVPRLLARNAPQRRISIWSAACASGQEAFSLAMLMADRFPLPGGWDVRLEATDISQTMVDRVRASRFTHFEANRGLPGHYLARYFTRDNDGWLLDDAVRKMVRAHRLDLRDPWPWTAPFDLILARNVLIYFDKDLKKKLIERFRRALAPGGYLILGASETALFLGAELQSVSFGKTVCYQNTRG